MKQRVFTREGLNVADTVQINLAKALKLKNRLAGRLARLTSDIQTYNSVQQGTEAVDVRNRLRERAETVTLLTDLKFAVSQANLSVQKVIFDLAERKAEVALLSGLNTRHGVYKEGYPVGGDVTYVAQFRKAEIDELVSKLEAEIDRLQDQLDSFNHITTIEIDRKTVDLGKE